MDPIWVKFLDLKYLEGYKFGMMSSDVHLVRPWFGGSHVLKNTLDKGECPVLPTHHKSLQPETKSSQAIIFRFYVSLRGMFPIFEEAAFRESTNEDVFDSDEPLKTGTLFFSQNCTVDVSITHRIHGTGIFTYIWLICMVKVCKYTIRGRVRAILPQDIISSLYISSGQFAKTFTNQNGAAFKIILLWVAFSTSSRI